MAFGATSRNIVVGSRAALASSESAPNGSCAQNCSCSAGTVCRDVAIPRPSNWSRNALAAFSRPSLALPLIAISRPLELVLEHSPQDSYPVSQLAAAQLEPGFPNRFNSLCSVSSCSIGETPPPHLRTVIREPPKGFKSRINSAALLASINHRGPWARILSSITVSCFDAVLRRFWIASDSLLTAPASSCAVLAEVAASPASWIIKPSSLSFAPLIWVSIFSACTSTYSSPATPITISAVPKRPKTSNPTLGLLGRWISYGWTWPYLNSFQSSQNSLMMTIKSNPSPTTTAPVNQCNSTCSDERDASRLLSKVRSADSSIEQIRSDQVRAAVFQL